MKLIRAEFENFRLLRDLELDFSTDSEKKLTVVRAENETGKTTILNALQWALYGLDVLPGKGRDFRLHPIDWETSDRQPIPISVQVDFEISKVGSTGSTEKYRIIRSVEETLNGVKQNPKVRLFKLTDKGAKSIKNPEAWIKRELLPPELREVFFTDGDRALSFIEAKSVTAKRRQVQEAIQSLLGLNVIEAALKHLEHTDSELNKDVKKIGSDAELEEIATKLSKVDRKIKDSTEKQDDAKSQLEVLDQRLSDIDKDIEAALIKGDREELDREFKQTQIQLKQIDNDRIEASKAHSKLFTSFSLACDLIAPVLEKSIRKLAELHDQGKLPSTTIPVLEERLTDTTCICGESLDQHTVDGKRRRNHIHKLIEKSRKPDDLQSMLTDLYYGSLSMQPKKVTDNAHWMVQNAKAVDYCDNLDNTRKESGRKLKSLEVQLDEIADTNIQGLRTTKQEYTAQRDRLNNDCIRYEIELDNLKEERRSLVATRNNLLTKQRRGASTLAALDITRDVVQVLDNSYNRITNEELVKVSELMNDIFLEMIGADPEQGAIIQKAEISKKSDILVYGPNTQMLNPDQDLNGASRRALTLAFIFALAKVSEVIAPNIIDTPLGMMSGFVKRSVLKTAIRESSQLILFLTRSEIADCEEILDAEAGRVITLTNPAHYPKMLVNNPLVKERKVLRCECRNCRDECKLCKRRKDIDVEAELEYQEVNSDSTIR